MEMRVVLDKTAHELHNSSLSKIWAHQNLTVPLIGEKGTNINTEVPNLYQSFRLCERYPECKLLGIMKHSNNF